MVGCQGGPERSLEENLLNKGDCLPFISFQGLVGSFRQLIQSEIVYMTKSIEKTGTWWHCELGTHWGGELTGKLRDSAVFAKDPGLVSSVYF